MSAAAVRELRLPKLRASAAFEPATLNVERREVSLRWYSGATVDRVPFFADPYTLRFCMEPKAVRLGRLNSGSAPLKADHRDDLSAVVGVISRAWVQNGEGHAVARFSERPEADVIFKDVRAGIFRQISMEAVIHELEDATPKGASEKHYLATSWTPCAVALVSIAADPAAQVLSQPKTFPCTLTLSSDSENPKMDTDTTPTGPERDELARQGEIHRLADAFGCGDLAARRWIAAGLSREQVLAVASEERAKRAPSLDARVSFGDDHDSPGARIERMSEGLSARAARTAPSEAGRRYADSTLPELALECLSWSGRHRGLDAKRNAQRVVELALHTTSDFPLLLGNVMNKRLLPAYENASPSFRQLAKLEVFNDFRPQRFQRAGDFPVPLQTGEHGEIQHGTMSENEELVSLLTYARIFAISRVALVNDDVGAFERLAASAANRIADLHNALFFSICIAPAAGLGPVLSDTLTVYHATHANVTAAGALSLTTLTEARKLMMKQTSKDGIKLNVVGSILLVSPDSLTLAEQIVAPLVPAQISNVNPFAERLTPIGDANLTGTRFYLLADPGRLAQYTYGFLDAPLRVDTRAGWEVEGVEVRAITDVAFGAVEHRAGVSGAGI